GRLVAQGTARDRDVQLAVEVDVGNGAGELDVYHVPARPNVGDACVGRGVSRVRACPSLRQRRPVAGAVAGRRAGAVVDGLVVNAVLGLNRVDLGIGRPAFWPVRGTGAVCPHRGPV